MHVRKKVAPAGNECYNVFFLIDFTFDSYVFRGGRKKNSELFVSAERWRPTLEV